MHLSCILSVVRLRVGWAKRRKCVSLCDCVILCAGDTQVHQDYFGSKYPWNRVRTSCCSCKRGFLRGVCGVRVQVERPSEAERGDEWTGNSQRKRVKCGVQVRTSTNFYFCLQSHVNIAHPNTKLFSLESLFAAYAEMYMIYVYIYIYTLTVYYRITLIYIFMVKIICVLWHLQ